jgi:hypothetical protein
LVVDQIGIDSMNCCFVATTTTTNGCAVDDRLTVDLIYLINDDKVREHGMARA